MENNPTANISFLKRELISLISIVEKEKERYDNIDYSQLSDDEAGEIGDEHEVVNSIYSMLEINLNESFK